MSPIAVITAQISEGNAGFADVCFLVAVILLTLAGLVAASAHFNPPQPASKWSATLGWLGAAFIALGFLVL